MSEWNPATGRFERDPNEEDSGGGQANQGVKTYAGGPLPAAGGYGGDTSYLQASNGVHPMAGGAGVPNFTTGAENDPHLAAWWQSINNRVNPSGAGGGGGGTTVTPGMFGTGADKYKWLGSNPYGVDPNAIDWSGQGANSFEQKQQMIASYMQTGKLGGTGGGQQAAWEKPNEDPRLAQYADFINNRMRNPDQSWIPYAERVGGLRRDLGEGQKAAARGAASARGLLSTSTIPGLAEAGIDRTTGRDISQSTAAIAEAARAKEDQFMLSAGESQGAVGAAQRAQQSINDAALAQMGTAASAAAGNAIQNRQLGLSAWQIAEANQRAKEAAAIQNWQAQINALTSALRI